MVFRENTATTDVQAQIIYLLNTAILPNFGIFSFTPLSIDDARKIWNGDGAKLITRISAIGHEATAQLLSELLQSKVAVNRITITMNVGDKAIVFKLKVRLPEGKVLSLNELREQDFELGLLERVK